MVNLSHDDCCGCGACAAGCPKMAITMQEDACGYIFPVIDSMKCIDCGWCDRHCPELSFPQCSVPTAVYAARCNDTDEFATCASGGAATTFARQILRQGGVVYGCAMSNYRTIRHIRVSQEADLGLLKGSKYVQSDMGRIYVAVKQDLQARRRVLFTGTPCQVGALRTFLEKPYSNLYTVDLVCHGVPSQAMLRNVIEPEVARRGLPDEQVFVRFRWKTQYGIQFGIQFGIQDDKIVQSAPAYQEPYMTAFLSGLSYRENCHRCRYATHARVGDLTIGDFWGLGKEIPTKLSAKHGTSLVLVNTARGKELWMESRPAFTVETRTWEEAVRENCNLHDPSPRPAHKTAFLESYRTQGLKHAVYCHASRRYRIERSTAVRFIRRTPALKQILRLGMYCCRKVKSILS